MLMLGASESTARAPMLQAACTAEPEVDHYLAKAQQDARHESWMFGALLTARVYVTEYEIVMGDHGPYVELQPHSITGGRKGLAVFTSRRHVVDGDPLDAQAMPFSVMLRTLPAEVEIELNPGTALARRLTIAELDLLRRVRDDLDREAQSPSMPSARAA